MHEHDSHGGPDPVFPVFLNLSGRRCLVVGGGPVALRKTRDLAEAGARVTVVAESPLPEFAAMGSESAVSLTVRRFEPADAGGMFLVFAATDDETVNRAVSEAARERGALVNVADRPALCDFYSGAVVKRGTLRIAVSTCGNSPAAAARVREELEGQFGTEWAGYLDLAGTLRQRIISDGCVPEQQKREALGWLGSREAFELFRDSGDELIWDRLRRIISSW